MNEFNEFEKEFNKMIRITDVMVFCRPWAYDHIKNILDVTNYKETELYKTTEIPENYIAIIVDKRRI